MTDRDALLAAVREAPDDDAPRLVLADWLDEHGQPERAEFIRVQVAMRREYEAHGRTGRLERLFVRSREVLYQPWAEAVREAFGRGVAAYSRGFPRQRVIDVSCAAVADVLPAIASWLGPAAGIVLHDCHGRLKGVAALSDLGSVPRLELTRRDDEAEVTDADVADLLASPHLGRLRTLRLDGLGLSDATAVAIGRAGGLRSLETLTLARNRVGPAGAAALAQAAHLGSLVRLDLSRNRIGTAGAKALLKSPHLSGLKVLEVPGNRVAAATTQVIKKRFSQPPDDEPILEPLRD